MIALRALLAVVLSLAAARAPAMSAAPAPGALAGCAPLDWWQDPAIPACPDGATLLPETYPALAYVVSDAPQLASRSSDLFADVVTEAILEASGERTPLVFLPVRGATFERISRRIEGAAKSESERRRWKEALRHVTAADGRDGATSFTWQLDYSLPLQGPGGLPLLRPLPYYGRGSDRLFAALARAAASCPLFSVGEPIPRAGEGIWSFEDARVNSPGNVTALPGDTLLVGTKASRPGFLRFFSGEKTRFIEVPTSFLSVGHLDEILKVLPYPAERGSRCGFAVALASPAKALELLEKDPKAPFFAFHSNAPEENAAPARLAYRHGTEPSAFEPDALLCREVAEYRSRKGIAARALASAKHSAHAHAACAALTNGDIADALRNDEQLGELNRLVQLELDRAEEAMRRALRESPAMRCPQPRFVRMPALFFGSAPRMTTGGKRELPQRWALALPPNPTNTLTVGTTILSPHPHNGAFARQLETTYRELGLRVRFVDTWDYAHRGQGDLHCATSSFRFCRPRSSPSRDR